MSAILRASFPGMKSDGGVCMIMGLQSMPMSRMSAMSLLTATFSACPTVPLNDTGELSHCAVMSAGATSVYSRESWASNVIILRMS
jgi:hypothetical protein